MGRARLHDRVAATASESWRRLHVPGAVRAGSYGSSIFATTAFSAFIIYDDLSGKQGGDLAARFRLLLRPSAGLARCLSGRRVPTCTRPCSSGAAKMGADGRPAPLG